MANKRVIGGRTTEQRIAETFAAMEASRERLNLTEFAHRAQVGYSTLCHDYKGWADRVRKHRDGRNKPKTWSGSRRMDHEDQDLIDHLRRELALLRQEHEEQREQIPALVAEVAALRKTNARLRGVQIGLHESLVASLGEQRAEQILSRVAAAPPADQGPDTDEEPF